ncbi:MAG: histidine kinase, partial [Chitinophagales bacterium]
MKTRIHIGCRKIHFSCWLLILISIVAFSTIAKADGNESPRMILRSVMVNTIDKRYDSSLCCKPDENNFQFIYEGVDLAFSGQLHFRYRLKSGEQWKATDEKNLLFPALPSGKYLFEVEVKSETSNWSDPVKYAFEIVSPLYMRWWFVLAAFLFVIAITYWTVTLRNKQYLKKQQEAFVAQQRMNEMENQAKQAMMNPHFVFNALNSIQQYINDNDRVSANKYLTKFSRLIRLNLDLVNKNLITLEEEFEKLKLYLEIEQLRFGAKLNYAFIIDETLETDMIRIPSMILQPFVENAIWHGLMALPEGGKITVLAKATAGEKMLCIEISDNGIGINQSKKLNAGKSRKSFGIE